MDHRIVDSQVMAAEEAPQMEDRRGATCRDRQTVNIRNRRLHSDRKPIGFLQRCVSAIAS
jgi:hypothetical protein